MNWKYMEGSGRGLTQAVSQKEVHDPSPSQESRVSGRDPSSGKSEMGFITIQNFTKT
jgi:hypothetical protein